MNTLLLRDIVLLIARTVLGVVLIAHGWQIVNTMGINTTIGSFEQAGIPLPTLSVWFAVIVQIAGGALMIVGLAVPLVGLLQTFHLLGLIWFVHLENGLLSANGGYEFVMTLAVLALLLSVVGAGRLSVDHLISPRLAQGAAGFEPVPASPS